VEVQADMRLVGVLWIKNMNELEERLEVVERMMTEMNKRQDMTTSLLVVAVIALLV